VSGTKLPQQLTWKLAVRASDLDPTAKLVALTLDTWMSKAGTAWPSRRSIASGAGLSVDAVDKAIKRLEAAGFLVVSRTKGRRSNSYQAIPQPDGNSRSERPLDEATADQNCRNSRSDRPLTADQNGPKPSVKPSPNPSPVAGAGAGVVENPEKTVGEPELQTLAELPQRIAIARSM
jgi:hypothetical protein